MMRAYVGARGPRIGRLRTGVGMSTHVTLTGLCVWLLVVGVAELAVVAVELTARLLKVVIVGAWAGAHWLVKQVRAHRRAVVERGHRIANGGAA
jgi:hypothetical protein